MVFWNHLPWWVMCGQDYSAPFNWSSRYPIIATILPTCFWIFLPFPPVLFFWAARWRERNPFFPILCAAIRFCLYFGASGDDAVGWSRLSGGHHTSISVRQTSRRRTRDEWATTGCARQLVPVKRQRFWSLVVILFQADILRRRHRSVSSGRDEPPRYTRPYSICKRKKTIFYLHVRTVSFFKLSKPC